MANSLLHVKQDIKEDSIICLLLFQSTDFSFSYFVIGAFLSVKLINLRLAIIVYTCNQYAQKDNISLELLP